MLNVSEREHKSKNKVKGTIQKQQRNGAENKRQETIRITGMGNTTGPV